MAVFRVEKNKDFPVLAVNVVFDSNKTDTLFSEKDFGVKASLQIIAPYSRQTRRDAPQLAAVHYGGLA